MDSTTPSTTRAGRCLRALRGAGPEGLDREAEPVEIRRGGDDPLGHRHGTIGLPSCLPSLIA